MSTPPSPSSDVLAALTIASTDELRGVRIDRDGSSLVPIIDESAPPVAF